MRFLVFLAFTAVPAASSAPKTEPPSSLRPASVPGTLRLVHTHEQVVACRGRGSGDALACDAELEAQRSGTSLTLRPVDARGDADPDDPRGPLTITFENLVGRVELSREIPAGVWKLEWSGLEGSHRFGIGEGEALRVSLATTTGACAATKQQCVLDPGKVSKSAQIPESHQVR